ncbi:MAG: hypothetical protein WC120_03715 [Parcubacteria group bacterium]
MKNILACVILLGMIVFSDNAFAHPGNTASDGCHYCRTNCDKWGVAWNERHCHEGKPSLAKQDSSTGDGNGIAYLLGGVGLASAGFWIKDKIKK